MRTSGHVAIAAFDKLPHRGSVRIARSVCCLTCKNGEKTSDGRFFMYIGPIWIGSSETSRSFMVFRSRNPKSLPDNFVHAGEIPIGGKKAHIFLEKIEE